jgi:hypothetical protein
MLIYVNQFDLIDNNSCDIAFRTISGWLYSVTGKRFTAEQLKGSDDFTIDKTKVRTYTATQFEPSLYSILLSHPDSNVRGRQWITEIGIKVIGKITTVSILLETSDVSTQVRDIPATTKPRLIQFLNKNGTFSPNTVGMKLNTFSNLTSDFKALSYEIDRKDREYPIVLVSNCKLNNKPLINPQKLQEQLVGLAQVIYSTDEINSWDLEAELTRRYSAWDGAVNIIFPSRGKNFCHNRLLSGGVIQELYDDGLHISQEILSYITHTTNGYKKKYHFSPTDVRAKRQKDQRIHLKQRFNELSSDTEYESLAEEAFAQLEEQDAVIEQLKAKHESEVSEQAISLLDLHDELDQLKNDNAVLKIRLKDLQETSSKKGTTLLYYGSENEFYKGEISDSVLEAIKQSAESSQDHSRKSDILADILKHNEIDGTKLDFIESCKIVFNDYSSVNPKIRSAIKKLNLEIKTEGSHNHMQYIGDERYKMTFSKSSSDKRAGSNIVAQIKSILL